MGGDTAFGQGEVVGCRTVGTCLNNSDEVGRIDHMAVVVAIAEHHLEVGCAGNSRVITEATIELTLIKISAQPAVHARSHRGYGIGTIELHAGIVTRNIIAAEIYRQYVVVAFYIGFDQCGRYSDGLGESGCCPQSEDQCKHQKRINFLHSCKDWIVYNYYNLFVFNKIGLFFFFFFAGIKITNVC